MPAAETITAAELLAEISAKLDDLDARVTAKLADLAGQLEELRAAWAEYRPLIDGYRAGGLLGARAAARNGRRNGGP
jgi:hypothetical protein